MREKTIKMNKEIEDIVSQIIEKYKPVKIILFGSASKGEFSNDSDIDLLVVKKEVPYYGIDRMREIRRLIEANVALDILVYRPEEFEERVKMGDPFIKGILKEGVVIHG